MVSGFLKKGFFYSTTNEIGENVSNQVTNPVVETGGLRLTRVYALFKKDFIRQYADATILHDITIIPNTNAPKSLVYNPKRYNTILIKYKDDCIIGTSFLDEPTSQINTNNPNTYLHNSDKKVEYAITGKTGRFEKCNKLVIDFDTSGRKYGKINGRRIIIK